MFYHKKLKIKAAFAGSLLGYINPPSCRYKDLFECVLTYDVTYDASSLVVNVYMHHGLNIYKGTKL
jgi:hypothetical protein